MPLDAVSALTGTLNKALADTCALYFKTKNFHWQLAERVGKIGGSTLRSIGHISRLQRVEDNDRDFVTAGEMLRELMDDNKALANALRDAHEIADEHRDVATASLLEVWIDEAEKRVWFLFEASRTQPH